MTDADGIRAFVLATSELDPELAHWVGEVIWHCLPATRRRAARDDLLRLAARRLPPLSAWQKAHVLADLARRPCSPPAVDSAAELVALAGTVYRRRLGVAQIYGVLVFRKTAPKCKPARCQALI